MWVGLGWGGGGNGGRDARTVAELMVTTRVVVLATGLVVLVSHGPWRQGRPWLAAVSPAPPPHHPLATYRSPPAVANTSVSDGWLARPRSSPVTCEMLIDLICRSLTFNVPMTPPNVPGGRCVLRGGC